MVVINDRRRVDQHSDQLREALEGSAARIVITTLQKFPVIERSAHAAGGRRFAVIVDEAHSSTSGGAVQKPKKVLGTPTDEAVDPPEATEAMEVSAEAAADPDDPLMAGAQARGKQRDLSFFAFTATPKPKTLDTFGQLGEDVNLYPFHTCSMRQAIEEGFILDVLASYTTYSTYYKLANAHPRDDPEMNSRKARAALAHFVSLRAYHHLEQKAAVIVEHFRPKTAGKIDGTPSPA